MILLLSLFLTLSQGAPLSPVTLISTIEDSAHLAFRETVSQGQNDRTIWDIVWSCLATIFACTWSALHPNIPGPYDSGWRNLKRRVVTTFYALIAPEIVTLWALKQYFGARSDMHSYNKMIAKSKPKNRRMLDSAKNWFLSIPETSEGEPEPWTMTHGFFIQMGGFLLHEDGKPVQVLDYARLKSCIADGTINPPDITAEEIADRSKGDFISKGLVVLQTSWFILQCITRWSQRLPLSELEVLTLGFAALNGITYALWWHKPQDVGKAFRISKKKPSSNPSEKPTQVVETEKESAGVKHIVCPDGLGSAPQKGATDAIPARAAPESHTESEVVSALPILDSNDADPRPDGELKPELDNDSPQGSTMRTGAPVLLPQSEKVKFLRRMLTEDYEKVDESWSSLIWFYMVRVPIRFIQYTLLPIAKIVDRNPGLTEGAVRMPMFASFLTSESYANVVLIFCGISALFGSIHLIAWPSSFPTRVEQLLWRISALYIAAFPLGLVLSIIVLSAVIDVLRPFWDCPPLLEDVGLTIVWICAALYGFARAILIFEAMFSLRHLSLAVYQDIEWTMFIPHL